MWRTLSFGFDVFSMRHAHSISVFGSGSSSWMFRLLRSWVSSGANFGLVDSSKAELSFDSAKSCLLAVRLPI